MEETQKRIVLIGPVYPYKGGISHYTGLMYRALCKKYNVAMVSYRFQYPKFLYRKQQKDFSNDSFKVEGTRYLLHTVNPVNWVRTAKQINALKPALVIIQWWHPYFAPCCYVLGRFLKETGILFVCHNVFPHERFLFDRVLTRAALGQGSCYIVQSRQDARDLQRVIKNPVFRQTVHPTYNAFEFAHLSKEEARTRLGLHMDEKVLLFFGFVRPYKGLKYLIEALPAIIRRVDRVRLLIVGDFADAASKQQYEKMIGQTGVKDHVSIYDGYIPDREVEKFFAACDLVVLPYVSATQSGIVQIAFGFEKPVIVTEVGGLPDVVTDGKTGYVVAPQNHEALADAVIRYCQNDMEQVFTRNVREEAYRFSWDRMVEAVESLCEETGNVERIDRVDGIG